MSKTIDRKSTLVLNSAGPNTKDVSQGNISYILPLETPNQDEAEVSLEIKDVRFGQKSITNPEITTIMNGNKTKVKVPFTEPLVYHFKKIEDDMIFKFAVTSAGDLLGFIYMEIPHKFKTMKTFKLDDWFPVKHLETEEGDTSKLENFVARIVVNYKGIRKLENTQQFTGKLPKAQIYEEMAKNLKQRIADINQAVEQFNDDGFKHLANFEKKLLKKKIKANANDSDPKKTVYNNSKNTQYINVQKDQFYKTRAVMGETQEIKNTDLNPAIFYQTENNKGNKNVKVGNVNCENCEKLLKELAYTRNDLIESNQRLTSLEEGHMTVDNVQLKRRYEQELEELSKDRKEYNLKLRDSNEQLAKDRERLQQEYQKEKEKANKNREEYERLIGEYKALVVSLKSDEAKMAEEKKVIEDKLNSISSREKKIVDDQTKLIKERQILDEKAAEMKEIKSRMMKERQKIYEEGGKFNYLKGDVDMKEKQLKSFEEFLNEEKEEFRREIDRKNREIDELKDELSQKKELYELELSILNEDKKDLERRNFDLNEEKKKVKIDGVRLWREKNQANTEMEEYMNYKKAFEAEKQQQLETLEKDYQFVDTQLNLIENQKKEFDAFKEKLEIWEKNVKEQSRLQTEQHERFVILQRNFFEKLKNAEFDVNELKVYAQKFGVDLENADKKFRDNLKYAEKLEKEKEDHKKNIENIVDQHFKEGTVNERRTQVAERKFTRTMREGSIAEVTHALDVNFKLKKDANEVIEEIFANVLLNSARNGDNKKDEIISELNKKLEELEEKLKEADRQNRRSKFEKLGERKSVAVEDKGAERKSVDENNVPTPTKVIKNPYFGMDEKTPASPRQSGISPDRKSVSSAKQDQKGNSDPLDLHTEVKDLCEAGIEVLQRKISKGKDADKNHERIQFLQQSKKILDNIFKMLTQIKGGKSMEKSDVKPFHLDNDQFDYEIIKSKYEQKIKKLIEYIHRVRDNTDFFNNNIDSEILVK
ncbi:MAG: hypothetical protein IM572_05260 [Chitinophagaceae bacterium]|jgi:hypothetical protein|nr:hypothetical protein [Chitinophagaceae bacterium]